MMYEHCDDLQQLTGKQFQDIVSKLLDESDLIKFRDARKEMSRFYEQEKPVLSNIRHNVGAHRDHDFLKQMEIMEGINWLDTIKRLIRFEKVTLEFSCSLKPLMDAGLNQIGRAFGDR